MYKGEGVLAPRPSLIFFTQLRDIEVSGNRRRGRKYLASMFVINTTTRMKVINIDTEKEAKECAGGDRDGDRDGDGDGEKDGEVRQ